MTDNYTQTISSHTDYEELRIELDINNKMAIVLTQEQGIDRARIEIWPPRKERKWRLQYHRFQQTIHQMLADLALRKVNTIADPDESAYFSTQLDMDTNQKHPFVKLYFKEHYLGSISQAEGIENAQLEIVACSYNKYWEFSYRGFTDLLNEGYRKLLASS